MVQKWLNYCPTVSQYNRKLYCDTAGLKGLSSCEFVLQYNNCIVIGAAGGLGKCIAIGRAVWPGRRSQYSGCIVTTVAG